MLSLWIAFLPAILILLIAGNQFLKTSKSSRKPQGSTLFLDASSSPSPLKNSREREQASKTIRIVDQAVFTGSVINLALTAWIMGAFPHYFYIWHTMNCVVLLGIRWYVFRMDKTHYFLYDFCYWGNLYSLVYLFVWNHNPVMFQVLFMISNGPLAWSIPAFNNSVIFHSIQQMTSVWIHFSPMALTFCLRWYPTTKFTTCHGECESISFNTLLLQAINRFYVWWIVLYYIWVFLILDQRIKKRGYVTLFTWVTQSRVVASMLSNISSNHFIQKAFYVLGHYGFGVFTMCLAGILWRHFLAHLCFIIFIGAISVWNGAGHYLNVFPNKYQESIDKKIEKRMAKSKSPASQSIEDHSESKSQEPSKKESTRSGKRNRGQRAVSSGF